MDRDSWQEEAWGWFDRIGPTSPDEPEIRLAIANLVEIVRRKQ